MTRRTIIDEWRELDRLVRELAESTGLPRLLRRIVDWLARLLP